MSPQFERSSVNAGNFELPRRSNSQKKRSKALSFGDLSITSYSSHASSKSPIQKEAKEANDQKGKDSIILPSTELFIANDKSIELSKRPLLTQNIDEERQQAQPDPVDEPETADCIMNTSSEYSKGIQVSKQCRSVSMQELSTALVAAQHVSFQEPQNCREIKSAASLQEDSEDLERFQSAAKTTSWEEAKEAKATVRFRNKEAKLKGWEKHQKAQAEAKLKETEAKVEKILAGAREKMKERLASASKKAAKMTVANEVVQNQQAAKIAVRVGLMRKAGFQDFPSKTSFKCCFWGLRRS